MKRALAAAVLAVSLICLVAVATAAATPSRWVPQAEAGFQTFAPANPVPTEGVAAATSAPSTTPEPASTLPADLQGVNQIGVQQVLKATPTPPPPPPTPKPTPKPVAVAAAPAVSSVPSVAQAQAYALSVIGSTQYSCLYQLWQRESGWNPRAMNASSGAYGIPQALPGSKMAVIASDWQYNPITQVKWGLGYVSGSYGSACGAWSFWLAHGWY